MKSGRMAYGNTVIEKLQYMKEQAEKQLRDLRISVDSALEAQRKNEPVLLQEIKEYEEILERLKEQ